MKVNTDKEDSVLASAFLDIFDGLRSCESTHQKFGIQVSASAASPSSNDSLIIKSILAELELTERNLLKLLISLGDVVESVERRLGKPSDAARLLRLSKPFQVATAIVAEGAESKCLVQIMLSPERVESDQNSTHYARSFFIHESRVFSHFEVALDLLQYWEFLLKYQSKLQCTEFCNGVHHSLKGRIQYSLNLEPLRTAIPLPTIPRTKSRTSEVLESEIVFRLKRVMRRIDEMDKLKKTLRSRAEANVQKDSRGIRELICDELDHVLSDLVHLTDNVSKWLRATHQNPDSLSMVEEVNCYRVAACYVNTCKHGSRGKNKASANAEYQLCLCTEDKVVAVDLLINFKGEAWTASLLIEELLLIWELFLRTHTDLDISHFRRSVAVRIATREDNASYEVKFEEPFDSDLKEKWSERLKYEV